MYRNKNYFSHLNVLRLVLWLKIWPIFMTVPCMPGKYLYSAVVEWNALYIYQLSHFC